MILPSARSLPPALGRGMLVCLTLLLACGDDGGSTSTTTSPMGSSGGSSSSTGAGSEASTTDDGADGTTGATEESSSGGTTGGAGDPNYPAPQGGTCPGNTVPITLPGAEICAPFCTAPADRCPTGVTGDAPSQCTPFEGPGGSGRACDGMTPCMAEEICTAEGTCQEVAFWACQLVCGAGQTCPDGMSCSGIGTCGY